MSMRLVGALAVLVIAVSVGLQFLGWDLVKPQTGGSVPEGHALKAPEIFVEVFGDKLAAFFPPIVLSFCTLLGIFANILYRYTQGDIDRLTKEAFGPLLLSPLVLYATYAIAVDHPDGFIASLLAFQNGFFWQAVFERRQRESAQEAG